jgi:hypothetical protein
MSSPQNKDAVDLKAVAEAFKVRLRILRSFLLGGTILEHALVRGRL